MHGEAPPVGTPPASTNNLFTIGADTFGEVQKIIGSNRVRSLRVKLGPRTLKEIPVGPLTAVTTILLVALAVIVSNITIEVEHEPAASEAHP